MEPLKKAAALSGYHGLCRVWKDEMLGCVHILDLEDWLGETAVPYTHADDQQGHWSRLKAWHVTTLRAVDQLRGDQS